MDRTFAEDKENQLGIAVTFLEDKLKRMYWMEPFPKRIEELAFVWQYEEGSSPAEDRLDLLTEVVEEDPFVGQHEKNSFPVADEEDSFVGEMRGPVWRRRWRGSIPRSRIASVRGDSFAGDEDDFDDEEDLPSRMVEEDMLEIRS